MQRKSLFATSALMTGAMIAADAALAADPIRLEIRGFRNEYFGIATVESDVDQENFGNSALFSDGEVQFRGKTTLDNGIEIGVRVELEAFGAGDQVDENYVFIEGGFGRLQLGSDDPAPYQQAVVAPSVGVPINSGWLSLFIPNPTGFETAAFQTTPEISIDDNMINYFTPRFGGFQLGLVYIPSLVNSGAGQSPPFGNGEGNNAIVDDNDREHGLGAGVNFTNSFNGVDIAAAAGIQFVDEPDEDNTGNAEEVLGYNVGANFGFGGFTFGGSFGGFDADNTATDGFHWDVGLAYATGPWSVSGTIITGEREGDLADNDEDESLGLAGAVAYALGPGITTNFTLLYADYDAEDDNDGSGFGGVLGLRVNF